MDYTVLPVGALDRSHATDHVILSGWVLDSPVSPEKVKAAWATLTDCWPLLLARLRTNSQGKWEYLVPCKPSLSGSFAALSISDSIHNHYTYARPSKSILCTQKQNPHHLFLPYAPKSVQDLLESDKPMCHLHVTNFDDAALIGLFTPHILCDGSGVSSIIKALCTLINTGIRPGSLSLDDPFRTHITTDYDVPAPPQWRVLGLFQQFILRLRRFWESLSDQRIENYDIFIPRDEAQRLKAVAMQDIRQEHGPDTDHYISTSDAILAFLLKCSHPSTRSRAPLNVFYAYNMRGTLEIPDPYIHNAVAMIATPSIPCSKVSKLPLGILSLVIRNTIREQSTISSLHTWLRWRLANASRPKTFFSPLTGRWIIATNMRSMRLMDVDFTGALPDQSRDSKGYEGNDSKVRCVYVWGDGIQPYQLRNWIGLWADDPNGGIWTSAFLPASIWRNKDGFGRFMSP